MRVSHGEVSFMGFTLCYLLIYVLAWRKVWLETARDTELQDQHTGRRLAGWKRWNEDISAGSLVEEDRGN